MFTAFAEADLEMAPANGFGTINAVSINGRRPGEARPWVFFSFFGGGLGAHSDGDGLTHGNGSISMATIPPAEILEAAQPVMFTEWGLRPDSAGPGRHRGGFGAIYEIELLADRATGFVFGERGWFPPKGIGGGGDGAIDVVIYTQGGEAHVPAMTSKAVGIRLGAGDRIRIESPGGGGFGPAPERDADEVAADVREGLVSVADAAAFYGVVVDERGNVDVLATNSRRRAMKVP